jgi:hypothetical protein
MIAAAKCSDTGGKKGEKEIEDGDEEDEDTETDEEEEEWGQGKEDEYGKDFDSMTAAEVRSEATRRNRVST